MERLPNVKKPISKIPPEETMVTPIVMDFSASSLSPREKFWFVLFVLAAREKHENSKSCRKRRRIVFLMSMVVRCTKKCLKTKHFTVVTERVLYFSKNKTFYMSSQQNQTFPTSMRHLAYQELFLLPYMYLVLCSIYLDKFLYLKTF